MAWGSAAGGISAGLTQGLQLLRTQEQARQHEAQQHAQRLNLYMRAVDTVTKHPEALTTIQGVLRPYGMDLDPGIVDNVEQTRKAHGIIGEYLTSGDSETFVERAKTNTMVNMLVAKSPSLAKAFEAATGRAETARAIKSVDQAAREEGVQPGSPKWNDFLRRRALTDPNVAALIKGSSHLMGPEGTAYAAQDPRAQAELSAARSFGNMQGHERARATSYDDLIATGPTGITAFAPPPGTPMPGAPAGPTDLQWGPETFSLRSGPAMAMLGGRMDPVPPARGPLAALPAAPGVAVRGAPARSSVATRLSPDQESQFQQWYAGWAQKAGINPNPDDPQHQYDYRGAYLAGAQPAIDPSDNRYHWPSQFKADDHPNRYVGGVDTKTGQRRRTLADVEQERARDLSYNRTDAAAEARRDNKDPKDTKVTWHPRYGADGTVIGFYNPQNPNELRDAPPGFGAPARPPAAGGGPSWLPRYDDKGAVIGFYNPKDPAQMRDTPEGFGSPRVPPRPVTEKPKKYAERRDVITGSFEMSPPPPPASRSDAKDADKIARARAQLMTDYQAKLNASVGDAGIAANSALRKAGWDPEAIRAAQGKTSQYLPQQAPTAPAGVRTAAPASPAGAPGEGPNAAAPPAGATPAAAQAEYNRLRKAGHTPEAAKAQMKAAGW